MGRQDDSYKQIEPSAYGLVFEIVMIANDAGSCGFASFTREDGIVVKNVYVNLRDIAQFVEGGLKVGMKLYGDLINTERGLRAVNLSTT